MRCGDAPRYDALGLLRSRRTQVGDLGRLKLRQPRLAAQRSSRSRQSSPQRTPKKKDLLSDGARRVGRAELCKCLDVLERFVVDAVVDGSFGQ